MTSYRTTHLLGLGSLLLAAVHSTVAVAGEPMGTLRVVAVLIDGELQARPLPKHGLVLTCGERPPIRLVTGLDGTAQVSVSPGECRLESERLVEFQQRTYLWRVPVEIKTDLETAIELSNDNAVVEAASAPKPSAPDLPKLFREWQESVVTVWSESGHGSGFLVDERGIFLTNDHVVHGSEYVAVQLDERTKVQGVIVAADPERDIAVVRVHPSVLRKSKPVNLANRDDLERPMEGEPVFTIGSPLNQKRVMTTGIVSKVEKQAIISDININPGNSGGPLFAADGRVLGITTFGDFTSEVGPGISGVVRIDQADAIVASARATLDSTAAPSAALLPVDPTEAYPVAAMKDALAGRAFKSFEDEEYAFSAGDFDVQFQTPVLKAGLDAVYSQELRKEQAKRRKKAGKEEGPNRALAEMRDWTQYVGQNAAVLVVKVAPKLKEGFWSGMSRGLAASQGYHPGPAKLNFATDFVSLKLFCGGKEVQPIQPNRIEMTHDVETARARVRDAAYYGLYKFPFDAIDHSCGLVKMEIFSLKKKGQAEVKAVPPKVVQRVTADFAPYRSHVTRLAAPATVEPR